MCGITGFYSAESDPATSRDLIEKMSSRIRHRGPDGQGFWIDGAAGIALGHRRLSIVDLSAAGTQPMLSKSGDLVIVFNGEIYNHLELREELRARRPASGWSGHSDTETLLELVAEFGIEESLSMVRGMFAFAVWDRRQKTLTLARDRFGEKPLYYGWQGRSFLFTSDLATMKVHPDFRNEVDREALALMLQSNSIPAPLSIFRDVRKLPPGNWIRLHAGDFAAQHVPDPVGYWSPLDSYRQPRALVSGDDERHDVDELERRLGDAVARQLMADVPVGAFLSGGFDSAAVVTQMAKHSSTPVKTFTIGSAEQAEDESRVASEVARRLQTDHISLQVTAQQALDVVPLMPQVYSEPFGDSSQIPTFLVSRLAGESVKVVLSGDGGDELFGGYNRHVGAASLWMTSRRWPAIGRAIASGAVGVLTPAQWDKLFSVANRALPSSRRVVGVGDKLYKAREVLSADSEQEFYRRVTRNNKAVGRLVLGEGALRASARVGGVPRGEFPDSLEGFREWLMVSDASDYLPTDILAKVDRAAMAASLETRAPYLDVDLYDFAWSLPLNRKIRNGQGKWLLRQVVYRYLPEELMNRPKQGFGVPIDRWLRGPLREWAEDLLEESRIRQEGFLNPDEVRSLWESHLSGKENRQHEIWNILMFQAWLRDQEKLPS